MQPKKLRMVAFGPYAREEIIDFDTVLENDLFLVTGSTGSGKTTIFDAICFAIYGKASGSMRRADSLRSQFASDDLLTEVELDFSIRNLNYSIKRVPSQPRPKLSGDGFTEQTHDVELKIHSDPKRFVTGVKNVEDEIEGIIGLNVDQFKQIMMLPQGEFRKLLTSDSQDREKVLQKLFDTSDYNMLQNKLDIRAKELEREIKNEHIILDNSLRSVSALDSNELELLISSDDLNREYIFETLKKWLIDYKVVLNTATEEKEEIRIKRDASLREQEKASETNRKFDSLADLKNEYSELLNDEEKYKRLEKEICLNEKANSLRYQIEQKNKLIKEITKNKEINQLYKEEYEEVLKELEKVSLEFAKQNSDEEKSIRKDLSEKIYNLKNLMGKVNDLLNISKRLTTKKDQKTEVLNKKQELVDKKELLGKLIEEISNMQEDKISHLNAHAEKKERLQEVEKSLENINNGIVLLSEIKDLEETYKDKKNEESSLVKEIKRIEEELKKTKSEYYSNQAYLLAKDLKQGEACPVCGSTHHPSIALSSKKGTKLDDLNEKEIQLDTCKNKLRKLEVQINSYEDKIAIRQNDFEKLFSDIEDFQENYKDKQDSLKKEFEECKTELVSIVSKLAKIESSVTKKQKDVDELKEVEEKISEIDEELNLVSSLISNLEGQEESLEKDIPQKYRSRENLASAIDGYSNELRKKEEALSKAKLLKEELDKKKSTLVTKIEENESFVRKQEENLIFQENELNKKLEVSGFASAANAADMMVAHDLLDEKKRSLKKYEEKLSKIKIQIEQYEKDLANLKIIDINLLSDKTDELTEEYHKIEKKVNNLDTSIRSNQKIYDKGIKLYQKISKKDKQYLVIGELAKVARGFKPNPIGITFERYVLAAFLEEILKAANERLLSMTSNRYKLFRSDYRDRAGQQSGLELEVFDNYTGKMRHVRTLSGGESFKAALAMALGLSEVVQSYAGGIELKTMFIDEGFGTLDPESLDSSIDCLLELRDSGRKVGIISHVPELKERIPAQIQIEATSTGSYVRFKS
jgi:exonuclease SbcC